MKRQRNNWRVWVSKLYTCLDLKKFDEAIQACNTLLDFKVTQSAKNVPDLEEKCIRGIVGGTLDGYRNALKDQKSDVKHSDASVDGARRTLARVLELLERLSSSSSEPWVFETVAYFHSQIGNDKVVLENLMKEYRSLQTARGWEKDDALVRKLCQVVTSIVQFQKQQGEGAKSKFLVNNVVKTVRQSRTDTSSVPPEIAELEKLVAV